MTEHSDLRPTSHPTDPELGQLFDEIHDRLVSGESIDVDVDAYVARFPQHATAIRRQVGTMRAIVSMGDAKTDNQLRSLPGTRKQVGEFSIIREIGRGGMGVVYEAEQADLQRRVALKVLPLAGLASDRQLDRFRNEARAVASLHHSNIVSIHSIGREQGVHYFAMQLIEGPSLAELIHHLQTGQDGRPDEGNTSAEVDSKLHATIESDIDSCHPTETHFAENETRRDLQAAISTQRSASRNDFFRTAARWGAEAADALAHAHERGILHRDIKPANLLIDEAQRLWVTDFGLARLESEQTLSGSADILGTLRYMSPEQAMGKRDWVDHRSDIYSLGTTLFELLALRPAYSGNDRQQLLDRVISQRPDSLRKIDPKIPTELDLIVGKSMEREREDRYSSATDLANDLRAFLDNRPIVARPLTVTQRAARWIRHHQRISLAIVSSLTVLAVSLTAVTAFVVQQRHQAVVARKKSEENAAFAQQNFALAEEAVNQLLTRVSESVLLNEPQMVELRASLLEDALRFYEKLSSTSANSLESRQRTAVAQVNLGRLLLMLHDRDRAYKSLHVGTDEIRRLTSDSTNDEFRFVLCQGLRDLGDVAELRAKDLSLWPNDRAEYSQRAHAARKEAIEVLESLADEANARKELLLSYLYLDEGDTYPKYTEVRRSLYLNAIQAADRANAISPTPEAKLQRLVCAREFRTYADKVKPSGGGSEIIDDAAKLVEQHPEFPQAKHFLSYLVGNRSTSGGAWRGQDPRSFSLSLAKELHEQFPSVDRYKWGLAMEYRSQATRGAMDGADWIEVESARRASIQLMEELWRKSPTDSTYTFRLSDSLRDLCEQYRFRCDGKSRIEPYQLYIEIAESLTRHQASRLEGWHHLSRAHRELASVYYALGRLDDGRRHMQAARSAARQVVDHAHSYCENQTAAEIAQKRGWYDQEQIYGVQIPCELNWGDADLSKSLTHEFLQMLDDMEDLSYWAQDEVDGIKHWRASVLCVVGHRDLRQPEEALSLVREILARQPDRRVVRSLFGYALYANGRYQEAEAEIRKVRDAFRGEQQAYKNRQQLRQQALDLLASGRNDEAREVFNQYKAVDLKEPSEREDALGWPEHPTYSLYLAMAAFQLNKPAEAEREFREVRARWGSCDTFPRSARLYREAAALLGEESERVRPTALPTESPLPIVETLNRRSWRTVPEPY